MFFKLDIPLLLCVKQYTIFSAASFQPYKSQTINYNSIHCLSAITIINLHYTSYNNYTTIICLINKIYIYWQKIWIRRKALFSSINNTYLRNITKVFRQRQIFLSSSCLIPLQIRSILLCKNPPLSYL